MTLAHPASRSASRRRMKAFFTISVLVQLRRNTIWLRREPV